MVTSSCITSDRITSEPLQGSSKAQAKPISENNDEEVSWPTETWRRNSELKTQKVADCSQSLKVAVIPELWSSSIPHCWVHHHPFVVYQPNHHHDHYSADHCKSPGPLNHPYKISDRARHRHRGPKIHGLVQRYNYSSINHVSSFFSISTEAPLPRYPGKVNTWCSGSVMNSCREFVTTIREANVNAKDRAILLKSKHLVIIKNGFVHRVSHPKNTAT